MRDVYFAARRLWVTPTFLGAAVATLALGIGANATMFDIVDRLLFRPPAGVRAPDQLVRFYWTIRVPGIAGSFDSTASYPAVAGLRQNVDRLDAITAYAVQRYSLGRGPEAMEVDAALVDEVYFELLGVRPAIGSALGADAPTAHGAVISDALWRRRYGGDPGVLGRTVTVGPGAFTIVGVAPARFRGIDLESIDVWLPLEAAGQHVAGSDWKTSAAWGIYRSIGRLAPGVSPALLQQRLDALYEPGSEAALGLAGLPFTPIAGPLLASAGPGRMPAIDVAAWAGFVSLLVFVIACANVATLFFVRATRRREELMLRAALGASRLRLFRELMAETLLVSLLAGLAAVLIAAWGRGFVGAVLLPDVAMLQGAAEWRLLAFTAGLSSLTAVLCGLLPALRVASPAVGHWSGGRGWGVASAPARALLTLMATQVALAAPLLVGAVLFVASLWQVRAMDVGVEPRGLVMSTTNLFEAGLLSENDRLHREMLERISAIPQVRHAGLATSVPFSETLVVPFAASGQDDRRPLDPYVNAVTSGYLTAVGLRVTQGRGFTKADDRRGGSGVVLVNHALARAAWPGQSPLGQCVRLGSLDDACLDVAGVVEDVRRPGTSEDARGQLYVPLSQLDPDSHRALFVRTSGDATTMAGVIRREIQALDPSLAYVDVRPFERVMEPFLRPWQLGATMFALFGVLATTIAAVGLYGVVAYAVQQRTRELGIRIAPGAQPTRLLGLVLRQNLWAAAIGLTIGLGAGLVGARAVASQLYQVSPFEPGAFLGSAGVLAAIAALASYLPARRATRVDPVQALRIE